MGLKVAKDANHSDLIFMLLNRLAHLYVAQNRLGDALELISFMAHSQDLPDQMEDEIEEFTFDLQVQVDDDLLKTSWEQGKQKSLATVLLDILGE